jgi:hypothetical protein
MLGQKWSPQLEDCGRDNALPNQEYPMPQMVVTHEYDPMVQWLAEEKLMKIRQNLAPVIRDWTQGSVVRSQCQIPSAMACLISLPYYIQIILFTEAPKQSLSGNHAIQSITQNYSGSLQVMNSAYSKKTIKYAITSILNCSFQEVSRKTERFFLTVTKFE